MSVATPTSLVRLPAGPIGWLYPELVSRGPEPGAFDLAHGIDALIEQLASAGIERVSFAEGPRATIARERLGAMFRARGVIVDDPSPEHPSLERRLAATTDSTLLPLTPGPDLEEQIDDALADAEAASPRIPFFVTDERPASEDRAVTTRLSPGWWGILPGDRYPAAIRAKMRALVRRWHPDRYFTFLAFENLAVAGVDAYGDALAGRPLGAPVPASSPAPRARVIAVDGIDGAGKSSHVASIRAHLEARGLRVATRKMYRHGVFHETITDVTRRCAGDHHLHLWRLQRLVKAFDSVKYFHAEVRDALATHDVVLFDRYIHTHLAAGVGRYHHDPYARELLSVYPAADRVYLLEAPVERANERLGQRDERTVDENPYMLSRFAAGLATLAHRPEIRRVDATRPFEENRVCILADLDRLLDGEACDD